MKFFLLFATALLAASSQAALNFNVGPLSTSFSIGGKAAAAGNSSASSAAGASSKTPALTQAQTASASTAQNLSLGSEAAANATANTNACLGQAGQLVNGEMAKAALAVLTAQIGQISGIFGQGLESARKNGQVSAGIAAAFEQLQNSTNDLLGELKGLGQTGTGNSSATNSSSNGSGTENGNGGAKAIADIVNGLKKAAGLLVSIGKFALDIKKQIISGALEAAGGAAEGAGSAASEGLQSLAKLVSGGSPGGEFGKDGLANAALAGFAAAGAVGAQVAGGIATGLAAGLGLGLAA